jgi:ribosomal protein S18 acetylase RimI-like enzyme
MNNPRTFRRIDLDALLRFIEANAEARGDRSTYLMPSDVVWRLPGAGSKENLALWRDKDPDLAQAPELVGYAWFEPDTGVEFDLRADRSFDVSLATEMLAWAETRRCQLPDAYPRFIELTSMDQWAEEIRKPRAAQVADGRWLTTIALERDQPRIDFLEAHEFTATEHFAPDYRRDLNQPIASPQLAAGHRLRGVTDADLDERVAVHRAAWSGSSYDATRHRRIQESPGYDPQLDIVLETADGRFASYCIVWVDAVGVGSFEPVGTRPEWRGQGVGREIILEGLRRLKAKGMHSARVSTAGFNAPAQRLYESCGFERIDTARTYLKCIQ